MNPIAAYIHIPFCRRRCYYCDFPVFVVGDRKNGSNSGNIHIYLEALNREIATQANFGAPLETIFFGGGTPSLLTPEQIGRILEQLATKFGIASGAEISMEIDPGTFDRLQLTGYLAAGVNRFSMGVQAFQDDLLQLCGRSHTVADIYAGVDLIRDTGITNWSLDLISGLPQQTPQQWGDALDHAIDLSPQHISTYDLIVEAQTPFGKQYNPGDRPLPSDEATAQMYRTAQVMLTKAGYEHYEICNYARSGTQCRHNLTYWRNLPYYAFGMGAASNLDGSRFTRPRTTDTYYDWVAAGCDWQTESISQNERLLETLMLGMRLREGVELRSIASEFGAVIVDELWQCIAKYQRDGWVEVLGRNRQIMVNVEGLTEYNSIRLADPDGLLFSNVVLSDIFARFD
jgi:putative oxygen-independent coproporphyrinogen III oxidase